MANSELRQLARERGLPLWRIALQCGVSEGTLVRWLRVPLPEDKERRVRAAILSADGS